MRYIFRHSVSEAAVQAAFVCRATELPAGRGCAHILHRRDESLLYYPGWLLAGLLPWSFFRYSLILPGPHPRAPRISRDSTQKKVLGASSEDAPAYSVHTFFPSTISFLWSIIKKARNKKDECFFFLFVLYFYFFPSRHLSSCPRRVKFVFLLYFHFCKLFTRWSGRSPCR